MTKVSDLHKKWMQSEDYRAEWAALEPEYTLAQAVIQARADAPAPPPTLSNA